ncbi:hypothetical protein [Flavobacterium columnare]|uniref:Uncharacterized protein n=1 Tax=Flavobacterium columnare TaxID=996 RepID=A0AA94F1B9_9FLAO|nr:hypothetical protein [Flavobacterium columnare]MCH4829569.1 hypothetical protein [Flavobacterium columnare]MCH4831434.1 hypothetical protein [Flavobacterium columnare]
MIGKIWKIYLNANRSIYIKEDNKKKYFELYTIYLLIFSISIFMVFYKTHSFIEDSKILAMLLSLFSGLMYSVLLKIPDKITKLNTTEEPKDEETIDELRKREEKNITNIRALNYLKNFSFTLSYSIIVAIICIIFVITSSFFKTLLEFHLSSVDVNFKEYNTMLTIKIIVIVIYRFLFIFFMLQFIYFIIKSVIYLTEFTEYEFNNVE